MDVKYIYKIWPPPVRADTAARQAWSNRLTKKPHRCYIQKHS